MHIHSLSIHPSNRDTSLHAAVRSLIASTGVYTRLVLQLLAQAEDASMARTKPLYAPAPFSPSSPSDSASRLKTQINTYGSSNARSPVSRPSSRALSPTPSAFSLSHHGHGHVGQRLPNSQPQGYPLGMTQQALLETSLTFRFDCPAFVVLRCCGCSCPLLRVTGFRITAYKNARKSVKAPEFST